MSCNDEVLTWCGDSEGADEVDFDVYKEMHMRISRALSGTFDEHRGEGVARQDWEVGIAVDGVIFMRPCIFHS